MKNIISKKDELSKLSKEDKEADLKALRLIDRQSLYTAYNVEQHKDYIEKEGCPLCGRRDSNVYNDILKIKKEIQSVKFKFFENYEFLKHLPKNENSLDVINQIIDLICSLSDEKLIFLLLSQGNKDREENIKNSQVRYKNAVNNMKKDVEERDESFKKMMSSKNTIETYFPKVFPNTKIEFNDKDKTILITTPRNMETYSEGEKHEMYSTIRELAIIGSDNEIVIADEPLTDLDVANEYRNVFRFVSLAQDHKKKVIIFTCNTNFINIASNYHGSLFKNYYLFSNLKENGINHLNLLKMNFENKNRPYLSLGNAISSDLSKRNNQVLMLIQERNRLEILDLKNDIRYKNVSELLHYNSKTTIEVKDSYEISNDDLVSAIEKFEELPDYDDFTELVRDRIYYLAALRVYIEKKIFDYNQKRRDRGLDDYFTNKEKIYSTKDKIRMIDEKKDSYKITEKYKNWNRQKLMCLKTLLNDNDHPSSQILSFAISIGNNSFENEIRMTKELFS